MTARVRWRKRRGFERKADSFELSMSQTKFKVNNKFISYCSYFLEYHLLVEGRSAREREREREGENSFIHPPISSAIREKCVNKKGNI